MLGQRLSEVQNILMQLGYNSVGTRTTATYLDSIRKFYAFERGHIEVDTHTVISEKDKKYLLQILEKYFDEDFKQKSKVKQITQELEGTKKQMKLNLMSINKKQLL
ncbi:MAG: hypothetical protein NTW25_00060 [Candidatus Kapabacteria bacterium]|nr:hypothetical protein [Candidatus Kapabacteria bacterium]